MVSAMSFLYFKNNIMHASNYILTLTAYYGSISIELVETNIFANMLAERKVRL